MVRVHEILLQKALHGAAYYQVIADFLGAIFLWFEGLGAGARCSHLSYS